MAHGRMPNAMQMMQSAMQKMQQMQDDLGKLEVEGQSGAGMVKVVMNGNHEIKRVSIDQSAYEDDKEILEDLLAAAFNDAIRRLAESSNDKLSALTGNLPLPPGFKLPF
ncbi:MAG: YbaB/EbfC family nucleoid-associated protein [Succinivibrio sp.]|nr:YbaB/EbfC family nucleoid-associated protein [Succinivibrio sp.]